ncbi:MAG: shikimate dehydrogenase family protein [Candidatus Limnocylindria bacterium]
MTRTADTLAFLGVTATRSSINRLFPQWASALGISGTVLEPIDLPLDTDAAAYRAVIADLRDDACVRGALVTTHKVRILDAARDLFDELDEHARLLGEVSCISKRDGRFIGQAKDVITGGRALELFVPPGHFASGAEVLCLGAGGAGLAIAVHLLVQRPVADRPRQVTLVNRSARRLDACRSVFERLGVADRVELVCNALPEENDRRMAALPGGSLVINATGMGKDRPGSPVTDAVQFPAGGIAWELNYRGRLRFLEQASTQHARLAAVEDGWRYFVLGWSEVIGEIFGIRIDAAMLRRLSAIAEVERL